MQTTVDVADVTKLLIKVFVIGYKEQGESIIMLFIDQPADKVIYSIVIDSCLANDGTNKALEILNEYEVETLNILCWTHPDTDHTLGIDDLVDIKCDKSTMILIPDGLYGRENDPINYNDGDKERIANLYRYNTQKRKCVIPIGPRSLDWERVNELQFDDLINTLDVVVLAMSPHKEYITENITLNKKINKNDLSISLMVKVGEYKFDFCGDITKRTINHIWKIPFDRPLFLKTPHHTSRHSINLLDILKVDDNSLACTTTFSRDGLPHEDAIQSYLERYKQFHSTGTTDADLPNFGMLEYSFDLFDKKTMSIKCHGHAHKIEKESN
jgi:beta-lactamase superfamily II metal-dependent hydrolase